MNKIRVNLKKTLDHSYDILIGKNILAKIPGYLKEKDIAHSYALITDSNVEELYGVELYNNIKPFVDKLDLISFPAGEENKNRDIKSYIEDFMLSNKFGRDSAIIALGGGVVGDIAGFVAATYARGIPYIQVPTSLVACVDSSIGGKTAIDTKYGKNLIGAFHQPYSVYIDIDTLKTLNKKEVNEGLAEIIKYGVIKDSNLFNYLEDNINNIYDFNDDALIYIVSTSCTIKAEVVEKDEKESNLRKILNFGHTIGHAIEQLSEYKISHGEAISRGMVLEGQIASKITKWSVDDQIRLMNLFKKADLPTDLPDYMDINDIIDIMKIDKKARRGQIEMSLPNKIGEMAEVNSNFGIKIEDELIKSVLSN